MWYVTRHKFSSSSGLNVAETASLCYVGIMYIYLAGCFLFYCYYYYYNKPETKNR